jgi:hypothetical protein
MATVAAHIQSVFVRTDTTAASSGDRIDGLTDASLSEPRDMVETNYLGGSGYKSRIATLGDTSLDLSGHWLTSDAPQGILRTAHTGGTSVYITIYFDSTASAGSKGKRINMLVSEYSEKLTPGGAVEFSVKLIGNGAPVAI